MSELLGTTGEALTLLFSVPGAYAVARLRFKGQKAFSRSILMIYMVPMIVLALPIYIVFSMTGLRNTIIGIVLIYPVTTIPVALYMLQGYFRGLPAEVEEAGLMDGLSRLQVIWKITLPLALPALASVSLYVFMIAWNEFLLAFMLLDDPSKFTLTRGIASLKISQPSSVTPMECSNWAERDLSFVTAVQSSLSTLVSARPRLIIGSMVKNMPGCSSGPDLGRP